MLVRIVTLCCRYLFVCVFHLCLGFALCVPVSICICKWCLVNMIMLRHCRLTRTHSNKLLHPRNPLTTTSHSPTPQQPHDPASTINTCLAYHWCKITNNLRHILVLFDTVVFHSCVHSGIFLFPFNISFVCALNQMYLSDAEFEATFQMSKEAYQKLMETE